MGLVMSMWLVICPDSPRDFECLASASWVEEFGVSPSPPRRVQHEGSLLDETRDMSSLVQPNNKYPLLAPDEFSLTRRRIPALGAAAKMAWTSRTEGSQWGLHKKPNPPQNRSFVESALLFSVQILAHGVNQAPTSASVSELFQNQPLLTATSSTWCVEQGKRSSLVLLNDDV
ncbi:hypothetical protein RRG08_060288 [Elysia crispata]|uniref:Uncharacterized protein n=1 Tax=Elysia crispata TaxID=231223 RepID=A0AAE1ADG6_9GAST|nr:hypothetical protein RRG08_060288 [Elysia crispata]